MPYATVTLSSVGTSPPVNLNWRGGKPATVVVVSSASGSSGSVVVQFTLDDLQLSSSPTWFGFSSNTYSIDFLSGTIYNASAIFPDGVYVPIPTPVAAVRINSSALSQGFTMKVIQGDGW
jgi:hypothetical protein